MTPDTPSAAPDVGEDWGEGPATASPPSSPTTADTAPPEAAAPDAAQAEVAAADAAAGDAAADAIPTRATAAGNAAADAIPAPDPAADPAPAPTAAPDAAADAADRNAAPDDAAGDATADAILAPDPTADPAPAPNAPPTPAEPDEESLRLAEALVFASAAPVSARALSQLLPDTADADAVIAALRARYAGRGVELVETAGGVQFRTAAELAPRLRKVIDVPRKLPRVAMETLAIIAYHQPCTRPEIEEIRGTSLSQQTLDALLEANLVAPKGRREVPGRPTLWGTTPQFLAQFGLKDIRDLPQRGDLLLETPQPTGVSNAPPLVPDMPEPPPEAGPAPPDRAAQPDAGEGQGLCP